MKLIKEFIEKLRELDDKKKKNIVFSIVGVLGIIFFYIWIQSFLDNVKGIPQSVSNAIPKIDLNVSDQLPDFSSQANTNDWNLYQNEEHQFLIKHPKETTVEESSIEDEFIVNIVDNGKIIIKISVLESPKDDYEEISDEIVMGSNNNWKLIKENPEVECYSLFTEYNEKQYFIDDNCQDPSYQLDDNPQSENNILISNIIQSFQFINEKNQEE